MKKKRNVMSILKVGSGEILLKMKLLTLLIFAAFVSASASSYSQSVKFNLNMKEVSIRDVFQKIEEQSEFIILFNEKSLNVDRKVNVTVKDGTVDQILDQIFEGKKEAYQIFDRQILISKLNEVSNSPYIDIKNAEVQQPLKKEISGTVKDSKGLPLPGVTIVVKGQQIGTITDNTGTFRLSVPENTSTLVLSFIGMKTKELNISGKKIINVVMTEETVAIDDVVVTGYFEKSKQTFTGATTTYTGTDLRAISNTNILSSLAVVDPSFNLIENNNLGSDPNNMPDFQIRGATNITTTLDNNYTSNPNRPIFMLDGFQVSLEKIIDIDPNRIRAITILKDAAALAIYGSRGSNGVVVITTTPPEAGKLKATYSTSVNFEAADLSDYHLLNAAEKLQYEVLAGLFKQNDYIVTKDKLTDWYNQKLSLVQQGINTDWITKPIKRLGTDTKHSLALEGGDNVFRYKIDVAYNPQTGVMKGSERNRIGIGIKLQYNYKNLKFKNYISFDNVKSQNSPYGSFSKYAYLNPYYYPYDESGNVRKIMYRLLTSSSTTDISNPMYNATINTKDETRYDNFSNNFNVEWDLFKGFKLTSTIAIDKKTSNADNFRPADHTDFIGIDLAGAYKNTSLQQFSYEGTMGLSYTKEIKKHLFVLNSNFNIREENSDSYSVNAYGFPNELMDHFGMGLEYQDGTRPTGSQTISRLMGALANLNYSYDQRYLVDFAFRLDGSSQFGSNKRWGGFWSAGLGWNLHKESFLKNSKTISLLKLRGSLGFTGGQNYYPYQALLMYQFSNSLAYTNYIGAVPMSYGNPDLKWQRTLKRNLGADFSLFREKLNGTLNIYSEDSKDVLVDVALPPSLGFSTYKSNLGEVQNRGFDLMLQAKMISNNAKQTFWTVFGSVAHNGNKLMKISDALQAYNNKADGSVSNKPTVRFIEGQSMNTIWVVKSLGIDPATGNEVFLDKAGKLTNVWSTSDYMPFGTTDPKIQGTAGTTIRFKKLQLSLFSQYRFGGKMYNSTLVDKVENVDPYSNVDSRVLYDRWKNPGDNAMFKNISNKTKTYPTSRFVITENLLDLKSINLSYTINSQDLGNTGIEQLRFTAYLNDVFRLSTVKAERGINYPFAKHYALALQITF